MNRILKSVDERYHCKNSVDVRTNEKIDCGTVAMKGNKDGYDRQIYSYFCIVTYFFNDPYVWLLFVI